MADKLKLGTIKEEAAACRKAFEGFEVGGIVLHCHHESLFERLTEPASNRIDYILAIKPKHEQALRLRLFRPVTEAQLKRHSKAYAKRKKADAEWEKAYAEWKKADAERKKAYAELITLLHFDICKGCPWDGKTIFSEAKP